jgi:hypothetical protein
MLKLLCKTFQTKKERKIGKKGTTKTHHVLYQANSQSKIKYIMVTTSLYKQMRLMTDIQLLKSYNHILKQKNMRKKALSIPTELNPMQLYKTQNSMIHTYLKFIVTSLDRAYVFTK